MNNSPAKVVMWVLVGIGALVVLGGVVIPVVSWLLGTLGWLIAGVAVIGGGIALARWSRSSDELPETPPAQRLP